MEIKTALLIFWIMAVKSQEIDWMSQCNKCKCTWSEGKKTATCSNTNLNSIPQDLSPEIRVIDFSNNPLYALQNKVFLNANLRDIHKLWLSNCSIDSVHKAAFIGLSLLIELDLSKNTIITLDRDIFADNKKLRVLNLSHNKIGVIEDGLFYNMTHLQKILLSYNEISRIGDEAFVMLDTLQTLDLGYNRLKTISSDFTSGLKRLNSLYVEENPWICDCHLNTFRDKTIKENLITKPTECAEPERLRGRTWTEPIIFACVPQIVEPLPGTQIEATSSNVTLTCKVAGEPQPDVDWYSNGRIVDRDPRQNTQKFVTSKRKTGEYTWNNLTIVNVSYRDKGDYKCVAKNPGGLDDRNVTLLVSYYGDGGTTTFMLTDSISLVIGLSCAAVIILLIILIFVCCCFKKKSHGMVAKRRDMTQTSDEYIGLHGQPEMEKALITDVNPVIKPPRASMPNSVTSGGTEVSDTKKNLLDNDSVFTGDDESHSLDLETQFYKRPPNPLDIDYHRGHPYPPDLLSFPPRAQVSPAASSASTVADTSRLPAHHGPQSPMHSPLYDQINPYRTLPYSRSQSPFIGSNPRVPRQGYVTIPRRPRQSWSSEPPALSDIGEPLYDNLGLRTTADGSSALSLNKIAAEAATTPRSNRMFPLSPSFCDPISEQEASPSATTLPRNIGSHKLSPSRTDWARANAEALRSPEKRSSVSSMPPLPSLPSPDRKVTKIPPRPPPKPPKKRVSTGPLFEDEGEDGTEV